MADLWQIVECQTPHSAAGSYFSIQSQLYWCKYLM
uniref:Uncharacterized protein n=1 Tax=Anguilla anguilla TaxID=7936 RepID=A0A0E9V8R3_ANGAN